VEKKSPKKSDLYVVRHATRGDLVRIADINTEVFSGNADNLANALNWVQSLYEASPVYRYFVITNTSETNVVLGYAGWQVHGGFHRSEPVAELDQIGVIKAAHGKGLGERLLRTCITTITRELALVSVLFAGFVTFVVWGYADNIPAMRLYAKLFTEGVCGERTQFGTRKEHMYRLRVEVPKIP
jgi:ribosomal protein S18 acetylase RimI-like enzyme